MYIGIMGFMEEYIVRPALAEERRHEEKLARIQSGGNSSSTGGKNVTININYYGNSVEDIHKLIQPFIALI